MAAEIVQGEPNGLWSLRQSSTLQSLGSRKGEILKFPPAGLKSLSEPQPSLSIVFLLFSTVEPLIFTLQKEACKVPGD